MLGEGVPAAVRCLLLVALGRRGQTDRRLVLRSEVDHTLRSQFFDSIKALFG
jgi:hypothetical protein